MFLVEAFGIYTFAAYWFVKRRDLAATEAEKLASAGRAASSPNRKSHGRNDNRRV